MSILINLIPFVSPSNFVMSGLIMFIFPKLNPLFVALSVAIGATASKLSHFYFSQHLAKKIVKIDETRIIKFRSLANRWGAYGAFLAAISPIPDDPIVIPLGVLRFNLSKFVSAYLAGKVITCIIGAFSASQIMMVTDIFNARLASVSIILSIIALSIILKLDPNRLENLFIKFLGQISKVESFLKRVRKKM
jgi:membrane protein YqaA with SNARE-associated domain